MARTSKQTPKKTRTVKVVLPKSLYEMISDKVKHRSVHEKTTNTVGKWIVQFIDYAINPGAEA